MCTTRVLSGQFCGQPATESDFIFRIALSSKEREIAPKTEEGYRSVSEVLCAVSAPVFQQQLIYYLCLKRCSGTIFLRASIVRIISDAPLYYVVFRVVYAVAARNTYEVSVYQKYMSDIAI